MTLRPALAKLLRRWADKLAPLPPVRQPLEIWLFAHHRHAEVVGFGGPKRALKGHPHIRAVVVEDPPERIYGLEIGRVVITDYARRWAYERGDVIGARFDRLTHELRIRAGRTQPLIWIEL